MASKKGTLGPWTRMEASNLVGVEARFRRAVRARVSGRTVGTGTQGRLQVPSNSAPPRGPRPGRSAACESDDLGAVQWMNGVDCAGLHTLEIGVHVDVAAAGCQCD
jgi:hypothetical protein